MKLPIQVLFLIFSISSCGFHLRGDYHYPTWFQNVQIITNSSSYIDFAETLTYKLEQQNIKTTKQKSDVSIKINHYRLIKSISKTQKTISVTLTLKAEYLLSHGKTKIVGSIRQQDSYDYIRSNFLADEQSYNKIKDQLISASIRVILSRISRL